jgi:hypothetical protein
VLLFSPAPNHLWSSEIGPKISEEDSVTGSGANPVGPMGLGVQCSKNLIEREQLPKFREHFLASPGQLSDFELILLNLLRKLNSGDCHSSSIESLESEDWTDPLFNPAMVLFDDIVQVFTGSDPYLMRHGSQRFQFGDCSMLKPRMRLT